MNPVHLFLFKRAVLLQPGGSPWLIVSKDITKNGSSRAIKELITSLKSQQADNPELFEKIFGTNASEYIKKL